MFKLPLSFTKNSHRTIACYLDDASYTIASISHNKKLLFSERRTTTGKSASVVKKLFMQDVERLNLIGRSCHIVLARHLYQLIQMDAADVPETELVKALRWRLKGLVDYPLNDIAMDAFAVPPHGVGNQRKKAFVSVTPLSALMTKLALFESAFMTVREVTIAEMALRNILSLLPNQPDSPIIVISMEDNHCQLQLLHENKFYLVRDLPLEQRNFNETSPDAQLILLEIQRSIDYCSSELKLPEPQHIYFTPSFFEAENALAFIEETLNKRVILIDINDCLEIAPLLSLRDQQTQLYGIGGAIRYDETHQGKDFNDHPAH